MAVSLTAIVQMAYVHTHHICMMTIVMLAFAFFTLKRLEYLQPVLSRHDSQDATSRWAKCVMQQS